MRIRVSYSKCKVGVCSVILRNSEQNGKKNSKINSIECIVRNILMHPIIENFPFINQQCNGSTRV